MTSTTIEHTTSERATLTIAIKQDPSATAPEFSLTTGTRADAGDWHAGRWSSAFQEPRRGRQHGRIEAESALLGAGEVLALTEGTKYNFWMRFWPSGAASPAIRFVGTFEAR